MYLFIIMIDRSLKLLLYNTPHPLIVTAILGIKTKSRRGGAFILKTITPDIVSSLPEAELLASGNQLVEKAVLSVSNQPSTYSLTHAHIYCGATINFRQSTIGSPVNNMPV